MGRIFACVLLMRLAAAPSFAGQESSAPAVFASPEQAIATLADAVKSQDWSALRAIFGPDLAEIENPDQVQATNELAGFAKAIEQRSRLERESSTRCVLEVGTNDWPFPIPIVQRAGRWSFDTASGREELLNRRIGQNELSALAVMRACVEAQREYAAKDRDGDGVLEYAQKLSSSPGQMDGLYWPPELSGEISPLGPMVARAQTEGYLGDLSKTDRTPQPFHGYLFKILKSQGKHAPGGKYDYVINDNMIGGFALVGWPAGYGDSGIMTFIVNQQGRLFQKDLGPSTHRIAPRMRTYDPDPTWQASPD